MATRCGPRASRCYPETWRPVRQVDLCRHHAAADLTYLTCSRCSTLAGNPDPAPPILAPPTRSCRRRPQAPSNPAPRAPLLSTFFMGRDPRRLRARAGRHRHAPEPGRAAMQLLGRSPIYWVPSLSAGPVEARHLHRVSASRRSRPRRSCPTRLPSFSRASFEVIRGLPPRLPLLPRPGTWSPPFARSRPADQLSSLLAQLGCTVYERAGR